MHSSQHYRTWAWAGSLVVHAAALGALGWALAGRPRRPPVVPPAALVYLEPAPPPPRPAAGPPAEATVPVAPPTDRLVEPPRKPKRVEPVRAARPARPEPARIAEATTPGEVGGVPGGTPGGEPGGAVGGHGDEPIAAARVAHPPAVTSRVLPTYPPQARARGIEGLVVLRAVIDRRGEIEENVAVVQSIPLLDAAAVSAFRRWRFTPGRAGNGQLVRVLLEVPIRFQLR